MDVLVYFIYFKKSFLFVILLLNFFNCVMFNFDIELWFVFINNIYFLIIVGICVERMEVIILMCLNVLNFRL